MRPRFSLGSLKHKTLWPHMNTLPCLSPSQRGQSWQEILIYNDNETGNKFTVGDLASKIDKYQEGDARA